MKMVPLPPLHAPETTVDALAMNTVVKYFDARLASRNIAELWYQIV